MKISANPTTNPAHSAAKRFGVKNSLRHSMTLDAPSSVAPSTIAVDWRVATTNPALSPASARWSNVRRPSLRAASTKHRPLASRNRCESGVLQWWIQPNVPSSAQNVAISAAICQPATRRAIIQIATTRRILIASPAYMLAA